MSAYPAQKHHFQLRVGDRFVAWLYADSVAAVDLAMALRQSPATAHYQVTLENGERLHDPQGVPLVPGLPAGLLPTGTAVAVPTQSPPVQQAGDWVHQWLGQLQAHAAGTTTPQQPASPPAPAGTPWAWWTG